MNEQLIIKTNERGMKTIEILCDIALKHSGIEALQIVSETVQNISKRVEPETVPEKTKENPKETKKETPKK